MRIACGWAEFIEPGTGTSVARGRVLASILPCAGRSPWDGEVRLLRGESLDAGDGSIREPLWLLRFEQGDEYRWVVVRSVERAWAPSGLRATAYITSFDDEVPPVVSELGGE